MVAERHEALLAEHNRDKRSVINFRRPREVTWESRDMLLLANAGAYWHAVRLLQGQGQGPVGRRDRHRKALAVYVYRDAGRLGNEHDTPCLAPRGRSKLAL